MISAILVNYNGEAHLERCLSSLADAHADLEILLVDNASTDRSLKIVRDAFPSVRLLPQESNLGFAAGNNLAMSEARGTSLLLLNTDAWLVEDALSRLERRLDADPRLGLVAPRLQYGNGDRQFSWSPERSVFGEFLQRLRNPWERRAWAHGPIFRSVARLAGRPWYTAACILVRAEALAGIGGFDERYFMYFEDVDLCRRLEEAGWTLTQEDSALVGHAGGLDKGKAPADLYRPSQLRYYRDHRPAWEARFIEGKLRRRFGDPRVDAWKEADATG